MKDGFFLFVSSWHIGSGRSAVVQRRSERTWVISERIRQTVSAFILVCSCGCCAFYRLLCECLPLVALCSWVLGGLQCWLLSTEAGDGARASLVSRSS